MILAIYDFILLNICIKIKRKLLNDLFYDVKKIQ